MRLIATHLPTAQTSTFDFTEPGGTMGRCPGNHLLLSEDARVGRVQAVVGVKDGDWSLKNVSSRSEVILNGQAVPLLQEMPITEGDTLTIGDYTLRADRAETAAQAAAAEPMATPSELETPEPHDSADIFKELLDGPGVLPVGQAAEASKLHPFELDSQAPRNHPDPVQQLSGDKYRASAYGDTGHGLLNTEPEHYNNHIFSDPTPSTLDLDDPLATQRKNPINEALAHGHAGDMRHENR